MVGTPKDAVVTGDAVVLDVQIAQLPVRAVAALIDIVVMLLGYVAGVALWAMTLLQFDTALSAAVLIIYTVLVIVGYPVVFETATRGRTLGKMAMGLRVVSEDGGPERFRQALFRALSGFVEIWMLSGAPAVICSLLSPKGKRIGDIFAGTVVISERGPKLAPPPAMPPALAWWASSLQLSGLRPEQAELARQFLSRAHELEPALRDQMAARIAGEVAAQISPPPPPGAPPQYMLAAVLAERHRRELARLSARPAAGGFPMAAHFPATPMSVAPMPVAPMSAPATPPPAFAPPTPPPTFGPSPGPTPPAAADFTPPPAPAPAPAPPPSTGFVPPA
ncbi:RDD family protein [Mycolicibacterium confluentis]|uniref:RDD family protein n=2 Tax=Mycolicibacterium confluentis TaxID=28047 RepID=UPI0013D654A1|nr:RDD family protein [Mycolicibacterium confluentis]MCV7319247.1 RDD family protein [Mycolicibacterium confluentis]